MAGKQLQDIKTFTELIAYLRDELGWPVDSDDFDDLTYDYEPEEIGLDAKQAAKVKYIKQLRPLDNSQPFGIFFVHFEPKKLPVTVIRRILRSLVVKRRATAQGNDRKTWNKHDLLFISAYGEADHRSIAFAHFSEDPYQPSDLPALRVLGWDDRDTILHMNDVDQRLKTNLLWPDNLGDADNWRAKWTSAFPLRHKEVITTSKRLAERLAELAKVIRVRANAVLAVENKKEGKEGALTKLHRAFRDALLHDLSEDDFADMYAQTIAYGLLTARVSRPAGLVADNIADMVPVTNPFLKEMLETFLGVGGRKKNSATALDFDELGVNEVVEMLRDPSTNMEAVLRDFGDRNPEEDPVTHFYESFLIEYDKKNRKMRGVYYTPKPVVSYIVRSVHELLQTEFGLEDGLADTATWADMLKKHPDLKLPPLTDDPGEKRTISPGEPFVQILDPATGTGTFLVEVIEVIHRTLTEKWKKQRLSEKQLRDAWNAYVPKHLLPRLHAFELMMAPYAIAHMKIGLKLHETGYKFDTDERARVYMTNALEPAMKQLKLPDFDALAHEAAAVNEIKRHKRFTVVIGNPPYANFGQLNKIPFILQLLEEYKRGLNEKKLNITDDFIKFIRFSQYTIDRSTIGLVGMITNNVFIDGLTHRRMRESLLQSFSLSITMDLHGSVKKQESGRNGSKDENVFDIQQGVSVSLWAKRALRSGSYHRSCLGKREAKYKALTAGSVSRVEWTRVDPTSPDFFFIPNRLENHSEYLTWSGLKEIFSVGAGGLETMNDPLTVSYSKDVLTQSISDLHDMTLVDFRHSYGVRDSAGWKLEMAQNDLRAVGEPTKQLRRINYRPFDLRWTFYSGKQGFLSRPRHGLFRHLLHSNNVGLCAMRQSRAGEEPAFFVIRGLAGKDIVSALDRGTVFPMLLESEASHQASLLPDEGLFANFTGSFLREIELGLHESDSPTSLPIPISSTDVFQYMYAVFHSPSYRSRYAEFLKIDFPRLPLTGSLDLFHTLGKLGGELVALHLLESPTLDRPITKYTGPKAPEVEKPSWSDDTVWLDKKQTVGFQGVPEAVWNFHIGGYQVCNKWLKDRKGRTLFDDDRTHYQKVVVALNETIRLMAEIDEVIETHGGWPGAFSTDK